MAAAIRKTATALAVPALLGMFGGTAVAEPVSTADFSNCPANSVLSHRWVSSPANC